MGQVAGYTVADYLIQHASRERRYARVPASTWDALLSHIGDPADAARLADSAQRTAAVLLRHPAVPARRRRRRQDAALRLAELLAERGDLDELRARADADDRHRRLEAGRAAGRARRPGRAARPRRRRRQVRRRAAGRAAGRARRPGRAARPGQRRRLVRRREPGRLLAGSGDLDGLRARADAGDATPPDGWPSCWPSAATWTSCAPGRRRRQNAARSWPSCWPRAATWTSCAPGPTSATGTPPRCWPSCWPSAATWTGCAPGPTSATGRRRAARRAAGRARRPGRAVRARADVGREHAARLAELLAERGDLDRPARPGRRRRQGRRQAAGRAAGRARRPGRGLRAGPTPATGTPPRELAGLLAERGDLDEAARPGRRRRQTPPGSWPSCWPSAATWTSCAPGPTPATETPPALAKLLAERGDLDELRARADAGDEAAASRLAELLAERGDLDELRARADAGDGHAARQLAELLAERGDLDGLRARADAGDGSPPGSWPSC